MEVIEKRWLKHKYGRTFLGFKTVTLVPYEPKLIDLGLLSVHQVPVHPVGTSFYFVFCR
jgi:hypothetical protein